MTSVSPHSLSNLGGAELEDLPRTAGVVILNENGDALFQHRDLKPGIRYPGLWVVPGGHCDPYESYEACARREVQEETGYRCGILHKLAEFPVRSNKPGHGSPHYLYLFWTRYDKKQAISCHEGQAFEFLKWEEADRYPILDFLLPYWNSAVSHLKRAKDHE